MFLLTVALISSPTLALRASTGLSSVAWSSAPCATSAEAVLVAAAAAEPSTLPLVLAWFRSALAEAPAAPETLPCTPFDCCARAAPLSASEMQTINDVDFMFRSPIEPECRLQASARASLPSNTNGRRRSIHWTGRKAKDVGSVPANVPEL